MARHKLTKAERVKAGKVAAANMTPAQRKKRARLAVAQRWANFYARQQGDNAAAA